MFYKYLFKQKRFKLNAVFLRYLTSSVLSSLIGLFTGFFTYKLVEPALIGIWATFTVYEVYASFSRLGIINGLGRELPYLLGKGEVDKANRMASTALYYSLFSNVFLFAFVMFSFFYQKVDLSNSNSFLPFIAIILRILFSSYTSYVSLTFRTDKSFSDLSKIQNILSVFRLLSIILVVYFGFVGYILREFILSFLEMLLFHMKRPMKVKPKLNLELLIHLFKIGFPLFGFSYIASVVETLPRLYLIRFASNEQLGLFSPIIIMLGLAVLLPTAIGNYIYPKMTFEFGSNNDYDKLWKLTFFSALVSFLVSFPMFIFFYFASDYVYLIFPKYAEVSPYLKIASFAMPFLGHKSGSISFAVLKSWKIMFLNFFTFLIITSLTLFVLHLRLDNPLEVASYTLVFSSVFMYFFSLFLGYYVTQIKSLG